MLPTASQYKRTRYLVRLEDVIPLQLEITKHMSRVGKESTRRSIFVDSPELDCYHSTLKQQIGSSFINFLRNDNDVFVTRNVVSITGDLIEQTTKVTTSDVQKCKTKIPPFLIPFFQGMTSVEDQQSRVNCDLKGLLKEIDTHKFCPVFYAEDRNVFFKHIYPTGDTISLNVRYHISFIDNNNDLGKSIPIYVPVAVVDISHPFIYHPLWVGDLISKFSLMEENNFCNSHHGTALLRNEKLSLLPHWYSRPIFSLPPLPGIVFGLDSWYRLSDYYSYEGASMHSFQQKIFVNTSSSESSDRHLSVTEEVDEDDYYPDKLPPMTRSGRNSISKPRRNSASSSASSVAQSRRNSVSSVARSRRNSAASVSHISLRTKTDDSPKKKTGSESLQKDKDRGVWENFVRPENTDSSEEEMEETTREDNFFKKLWDAISGKQEEEENLKYFGKIKPIYEEVYVEPKTYLANERTLLQWLNYSIILVIGCLSILFSGHHLAAMMSIGILVIGCLLSLYALYVYNYRRKAVTSTDVSARYDDRWGPVVLVFAVLVFMLLTSYVELNPAPIDRTANITRHYTIPFSKAFLENMVEGTLGMEMELNFTLIDLQLAFGSVNVRGSLSSLPKAVTHVNYLDTPGCLLQDRGYTVEYRKAINITAMNTGVSPVVPTLELYTGIITYYTNDPYMGYTLDLESHLNGTEEVRVPSEYSYTRTEKISKNLTAIPTTLPDLKSDFATTLLTRVLDTPSSLLETAASFVQKKYGNTQITFGASRSGSLHANFYYDSPNATKPFYGELELSYKIKKSQTPIEGTRLLAFWEILKRTKGLDPRQPSLMDLVFSGSRLCAQ
eukprot:TRINITY_DN9283_c0_g1_i1.p1 TRINITY_DN9283_c0_g1~~TRINITY_DN9283_c0_g1_i1.p1  ORF type:complete len:972 (+),score=128.36 TRINITY_DN9283_c0_g1_i1:401-2917(+)